MKKYLLPALYVSLLALPGCFPIVAAGGATVGVAAAQEGGISGAVTDKAIYIKVNDALARSQNPLFRKIDVQVKEGRVLLAGSVPSPDMRVEAVKRAWQAEGVKQVINEIAVDNAGGIGDYVTDTWITGSIKTALTFDRDIQSINYTIDTVHGTVYIMGIAQDQKELDRVIGIARNTKTVKNVVSYARLRGQVPAGVLAPTTGPGPSAEPGSSFSPVPATGHDVPVDTMETSPHG